MMLRLKCDSTPPISPSPSRHLASSHGGSWNNVRISKDDGVLDMAKPPSYTFTPSSIELVKEINFLEMEILHLERYLLSLYRTSFHQHVEGIQTSKSSLEQKIEAHLQPLADQSHVKVNYDDWLSDTRGELTPMQEGILGLNHQIASAIPNSLSRKLQERKATRSSHRSLGDHLGTPCTDNAPLDGPDRLSEDIIRCITSIYCKLGDQNQSQTGLSGSSSSSSGTSYTKNISDTWSPYCNEDATWDNKQDSLKEERGPYAEMIEVLKINVDDDGFNYASQKLKKFRTLVKKLENVDPGKMKREQKLAFWINIHNALVMHAYLAYGTHNNTKSNSILKATYNIGGHSINAYIIQISILGIKSHFRAPWLQSLLSPGRKLKTEPNKHIYAIDYPEPLVHFALSLGAFSDPAVRIYNAKNVFQDLRLAKEEFIQSTVYVNKETRIYLPKILYYFAKDMALSMANLLEIVNACLSECQQKAMKRSIKGKPEKYVYWLSQSCIFRYVIHRGIV